MQFADRHVMVEKVLLCVPIPRARPSWNHPIPTYRRRLLARPSHRRPASTKQDGLAALRVVGHRVIQPPDRTLRCRKGLPAALRPDPRLRDGQRAHGAAKHDDLAASRIEDRRVSAACAWRRRCLCRLLPVCRVRRQEPQVVDLRDPVAAKHDDPFSTGQVRHRGSSLQCGSGGRAHPRPTTGVKLPGGGAAEPCSGEPDQLVALDVEREPFHVLVRLDATTLRPPARRLPGLAYDARNERTILFGGDDNSNGGTTFGDTWAWNGTSWTKLSPAISPPARQGAAMAYDPVRGRIVLFGGADSWAIATLLADTWEWDGTSWRDVTPALSPAARQHAAMFYDPDRRRIVLAYGVGTTAIDDVWEWDGATWTRLQPGPSPSVRTAIAYDALDHRAIAFGGFEYAAPAGDTWSLDYHTPGHGLELCIDAVFDDDGDGFVGCADPDCWSRCTPLCAPAQSSCVAAPTCGDGACSAIESRKLCATDCM